jgi:hypothetical protein
MAASNLNFFDYIKAAFHQKVDFAGLGPMPVNKMLLGVAAVLGFWNPGFWFLGIAAEGLYLWLAANNKHYQKVIQASLLTVRKEILGEKHSLVLKSLDSPSLQRYDRLAENCSGILKITGSEQPDSATGSKDLRISGLNRLLWMFLKLLSSRLRIIEIVKQTSEEELEKEIREISEKLPGVPDNSPLHRSLQGTLDIQKRRMDNYHKAQESLMVIESELDRIEKQVTLLREEASVSSDPELVSVRLDGVMDSLSGTNQWMAEHDEFFGPADESAVPDELIYRPDRHKVKE